MRANGLAMSISVPQGAIAYRLCCNAFLFYSFLKVNFNYFKYY